MCFSVIEGEEGGPDDTVWDRYTNNSSTRFNSGEYIDNDEVDCSHRSLMYADAEAKNITHDFVAQDFVKLVQFILHRLHIRLTEHQCGPL